MTSRRRVALTILALILAVVTSLPALARVKLQGYVEQGGQRHLNSGIFAITRSGSTQTNPYAMQSYPSATVTVYVTGTLTAATIYSDAAGTAKANPFTASSNAFWSFYIDDGTYDIRFSGGGIVTPYTWSGISTAGDSFSVLVTGFGAVCDGTTDDTVAIQAAINVTGGHTVQFPAGTCKITDQLLTEQDDITIQGVGNRASRILYMPTVSDEAAIKAKKAAATTIVHTVIRDLYILTTDTTYTKIGIWIVDGSQTIIENVQIGTDGAWRGGANVAPFTGSGSVGIKLQGRDFGTLRNVASCGAIPILIGSNPNSSIDIDHHNFTEIYLIPYGDNPNILVESGVSATSVVISRFAFVKGGYGLYWNETGGTTSSNITIEHGRGEQFTSAGHMLYIASNTSGIRGLRISDILCGSTTTIKGLYLRGIGTLAAVEGFVYNGTIECVNADNTVEALVWRNSDCQTSSTKSLGTLVEINGLDFADSSSPMPLNGYWIYPSSPVTAKKVVSANGVYMWSGTGSLADSATADITPGSGSIVTGVVTVTFKGATLNGAFTCAINGARTIRLATTDSSIADCTGNVAGDITVDWVSAAGILIRNRLGETVTYNYQLFWN